jgi:hypothetical protein
MGSIINILKIHWKNKNDLRDIKYIKEKYIFYDRKYICKCEGFIAAKITAVEITNISDFKNHLPFTNKNCNYVSLNALFKKY